MLVKTVFSGQFGSRFGFLLVTHRAVMIALTCWFQEVPVIEVPRRAFPGRRYPTPDLAETCHRSANDIEPRAG